jgi:ABC-type antimicrobial peptide transport system permease subunit
MVKNSKYFDLREDFEPLAFYPNAQDERPGPGTDIIVRSSLALDSLLDSLRHTTAEVNSAISIDFHVFDQQVKESLLRERLLATLSGCFGGLAIMLAAIGLYGVMAYMVVRRTNEIGIRMALGAVPLRILTMVVREAATLLGIGLAIGLALALLAGKSAATLLYGLKPHDPAILAAASVGLALVAFAATLLPARRAAHLDPMTALRVE